MNKILLEMQDIIKKFPGVKALNHVNVKIEEGSIHALVGENGAGKSTLMNVLSGVYPYGSYTGRIIFDNEECKFTDIKDSEKKGIVIIHQELALIPELSIMENLFLGNEQQENGIVNWHKAYNEAAKLMDTVGLHDSPYTPINKIGVGKQQLVEIAKALSKKVRLLIMDEPTAALNDADSEKLLNLILKLRQEHKMTCIIISHKLNEIIKVADQLTVIRDGVSIETMDKTHDKVDEDRIIKGMVGREITNRYPIRNCDIGKDCLEIKNWTVCSPSNKEQVIINNVNLHVRRGEVIGIAGLMGAGRTELAMSIFGKSYGSKFSGEILKEGQPINLNTVTEAIKNGIAYVTEDRKSQGLILIENIMENTSLPNLSKLSSKTGIVNRYEEIKVANEFLQKLNIKAPDIYQKTGNLSGGNQQKVMLAKWIYSNPDVLILDEPTRGIDVGAKYEIYCIINELAQQGKAVIVISSELPEIIGISDRIYVMNEGRFVGELDKTEATQESIMNCIMQTKEKREAV